jgi:hypothetical protein
MPHEPHQWLSREEIRRERRKIARGWHNGGKSAASEQSRRCLYCRGPLANGAAVCCAACDDGWWSVVPTIDGELWT